MNLFFYHPPNELDIVLRKATEHYNKDKSYFKEAGVSPPEIKSVSKVKTVDRWPLWAMQNSCILGSMNGLGYRVEGILVKADSLIVEYARRHVQIVHACAQEIEVHVCIPNKGIESAACYVLRVNARDLSAKVFLRRAPKTVSPVQEGLEIRNLGGSNAVFDPQISSFNTYRYDSRLAEWRENITITDEAIPASPEWINAAAYQGYAFSPPPDPR